MIKNIKNIIVLLIFFLGLPIIILSCSQKGINDDANTNLLDNNKDIQIENLNNNTSFLKNKIITKEFKKPEVIKDSKMPSGLKTTWQCVYFGSFPQIEILKTSTELPIDEYALNDDVIYDDELYESIKHKMHNITELTYDRSDDQYLFQFIDDVAGSLVPVEYDEDEDNITIDMNDEEEDLYYIKLDNEKYLYIREKSKDAEANAKKHIEKQYYKNTSDEHLFKFAPIKWRVVDVEGSVLTLISDKLLTSMQLYSSAWEDSDARFYLNAVDSVFGDKPYKKTGFYDMAFSKKEKEAIVKTKIKNNPNEYYGTSSGNDTEDYVYIPSNEEVFSSDIAKAYGFYEGSGVDDAARRFRSTIYAKYRGAWWSPVEEYKGNSFWFTRTSGYSGKSISYICDFGYIYSRGMKFETLGAGILPMIRVDASKIDLYDAGFVRSDEINKDTYKFKNVNEVEDANGQETSEKKKENVKKDYEIIEFGTYPQREIVTTEMTKDKMFYLKEGEYILDDDLHKKLDEKVTKVGGEIEIDGEKYYAEKNHRLVNWDIIDSGYKYYYDIKRENTLGEDFHYFKIEPIKWRVLEDANGKKTLITDLVLDNCEFAYGEKECTWQESAIIKWLNEDYVSIKSFYERAFNEKEKSKILTKTFDNSNMKNNYYFGTSCLVDKDIKNSLNYEYIGEVKVYILSEEDMFYGEKAKVYGFDPSDGVADVNRRFNTTAFARHNGTWFSRKDDENFGNAFYMTRTNGYDRKNIVYVGETGSIYNRGIAINTSDIGFLPVIDIIE